MSRILTIKYEYIFNAQSKTPKHLDGFVAYCMAEFDHHIHSIVNCGMTAYAFQL